MVAIGLTEKDLFAFIVALNWVVVNANWNIVWRQFLFIFKRLNGKKPASHYCNVF